MKRQTTEELPLSIFPVDEEYIVKVQMREIFELVNHGFTPEFLEKLPIPKRRAYFNMYIDKHTPKQP
jgi:hypothetical protein